MERLFFISDCIRAEDKKRSLDLHGRRFFLRAIFIERNLLGSWIRQNVGLCRRTIRFASLWFVCHHRLLRNKPPHLQVVPRAARIRQRLRAPNGLHRLVDRLCSTRARASRRFLSRSQGAGSPCSGRRQGRCTQQWPGSRRHGQMLSGRRFRLCISFGQFPCGFLYVKREGKRGFRGLMQIRARLRAR